MQHKILGYKPGTGMRTQTSDHPFKDKVRSNWDDIGNCVVDLDWEENELFVQKINKAGERFIEDEKFLIS